MLKNNIMQIIKSICILIILLLINISSAKENVPNNSFLVNNIKVIDGDTIECDVLLPLSITLVKQRVRLLEVDTWELRGKNKEKGKEAKKMVKCKLTNATVRIVIAHNKQRDAFGRILAIVWFFDDKWINLNDIIKNSKFEKQKRK